MNSIRSAICLTVLATSLVCAQEPQTAPTPRPPAAASGPAADTYLTEASITQTESTIHIIANSPRPLTQTLEALRQKYGWVVDYEDPQYLSKSDIVERPRPSGSTLSLPAGGLFAVDVPAGTPASAAPPEDKTLQVILEAYNQSKNPGKFELRKNEDGSFAFVGTGAQNEKGKISTQEAPLDPPISLATAKRSATETVRLICQEIAAQSHVQITVGITPRRLMDFTDVNVGGAKIQARTLLARTIQSTGHPMYWRLLFDPTSKGYFLDIHAIHK